MILEGIITTRNADGSVHVAPMGPRLGADPQRFTLQPYQASHTFGNLRRTETGILHIIDNVELLARAAINCWQSEPELLSNTATKTPVLGDACRWREFEVREFHLEEQRAVLECEVVREGRIRDFFGFNRAKHAVVEAAVLATRTAFLPEKEIRQQFAQLAVLVDKTAGEQERRAFALLQAHIDKTFGGPPREDAIS